MSLTFLSFFFRDNGSELKTLVSIFFLFLFFRDVSGQLWQNGEYFEFFFAFFLLFYNLGTLLTFLSLLFLGTFWSTLDFRMVSILCFLLCFCIVFDLEALLTFLLLGKAWIFWTLASMEWDIWVGMYFFSEIDFKKRLTNVSFYYFYRFGFYGILFHHGKYLSQEKFRHSTLEMY
jgi:hypothetical protein